MSSSRLAAHGSPSQTGHIFTSNKRRLSSAGDEPAAKKLKNESRTQDGQVDEAKKTSEDGRLDPQSDSNAASSGRDKKRRRKKKKKVPVVQDAGAEKGGSQGQQSSPALNGPRSSDSVMQERDPHRPSSDTSGPSSSTTLASSQVVEDYADSWYGIEMAEAVPSMDKGKGRARSPAGMQQLNSTDVGAIATHRSLLSSILPSLTCQICLLLMHRPFALAPCGHVACHPCLVSWFSNDTSTSALPAAARPVPPADGSASSTQPTPSAPPPRSNLAVHRKKTCPHCRAVVREKPVEVWIIKDMVGNVVRSGLADEESTPLELRSSGTEPTAEASNADPWHSIFPGPAAETMLAHVLLRENVGIRDEADEGVYRCVDCAHEIWDGVCSACGRVYHGHDIDFDMSDLSDDDDIWFAPPDGEDEEGHELFRNMLSHRINLLSDLLGDNEEGSDEDGSRTEHHSESDQGSAIEEDEGYESSFIDDDGGAGPAGGNESEVIEVYPPPTSRSRQHSIRRIKRTVGGSTAPVVISSDEEDVPGPSSSTRLPAPVDNATRTGRRGRRVVASDAEDDDDNLAATVASRERDMYGDDGSLPSRLGRMSRHRADHMFDDDDLPESRENSDEEEEEDEEDESYHDMHH